MPRLLLRNKNLLSELLSRPIYTSKNSETFLVCRCRFRRKSALTQLCSFTPPIVFCTTHCPSNLWSYLQLFRTIIRGSVDWHMWTWLSNPQQAKSSGAWFSLRFASFSRSVLLSLDDLASQDHSVWTNWKNVASNKAGRTYVAGVLQEPNASSDCFQKIWRKWIPSRGFAPMVAWCLLHLQVLGACPVFP